MSGVRAGRERCSIVHRGTASATIAPMSLSFHRSGVNDPFAPLLDLTVHRIGCEVELARPSYRSIHDGNLAKLGGFREVRENASEESGPEANCAFETVFEPNAHSVIVYDLNFANAPRC